MMNFEDNELKETSKTNSHLPLIFVALAISEPMMFIDEFIEGFLNQEYPKENIIICISTTSKKSGMISSKHFSQVGLGWVFSIQDGPGWIRIYEH